MKDSKDPAKASLWGGRFEGGLAPSMESLNRSLTDDFRLWPEDIQGSAAWAAALVRAEVLTPEEGARITEGLHAVSRRLTEAKAADFDDEDVHTLVERLLREEVGPLAGKLHTGRSRNDQVATDLRLWGRAALDRLDGSVADLARALLGLAERSVDVLMPGYTHLQPAQPVRGGHWALSHLWPLLRDRDRLAGARRGINVLPLGSGALAGCPFPIDRRELAASLDFEGVAPNSLDAVSDRDWMAEILFAGALLGVHLSRLGEDLVLFASPGFGFLRLSDGFSTGSSLMPQKRNPDVAELTRGKTGALVGSLMALLVTLKGLPTGYNRDLQEDKAQLFSALDTLELTLPAVAGAISSAQFQEERARAAIDPGMLATDVADGLVERGVPFRESHEIVGRFVRAAEDEGLALDAFDEDALRQVDPRLGAWVAQALDVERSVERRSSEGGTARAAVEAQISAARALLG